MKCKECNGLGKIRLMPFNYVCTCAECNGTGEMKDWLTNEEYIRSCSVEELAGIIYEWHTKGYTKGEIGFPLKSIMEVVEWLKQPHTFE